MGLDFRIILNCDKYQKSGDGYIDATTTEAGLKYLYESDNSIKVKVVGIIRKSDNAVSSFLNGAVGYTSALTDYILDRVSSSELIAMQKENPDVDVLTGLKFPVEGEEPSEDEIKAAVDEWSASSQPYIYRAFLIISIKSLISTNRYSACQAMNT